MYQFLPVIGIALALPLSAWAFPIDVELQPGAAQVSVRTTDLSNLAALMLTNRGEVTLQCRVSFVNGPERPVPRRVRLQPGEEVAVSQFFRRAINRVRVGIDCAPEEVGMKKPAYEQRSMFAKQRAILKEGTEGRQSNGNGCAVWFESISRRDQG